MQTHFEQELADLKAMLLTMGSHAESAVRDAVQSLMLRQAGLVDRVAESEEMLDRLEVAIDQAAILLLAKAPLASDLRLITTAMKASQNLERVGDEASKIAKRVRDLLQEPPLKQVDAIPDLARLALDMLKRSLDAFVNRDATAARAVIPEDKAVDAAHRELYRELAAQMMEKREVIGRSLHLIVVAKSLERIGDHAKNIAEEVVYLCEAEDIRHTSLKPVPSASAPPSM